jgi:hypothetical protein
MIDDLGQADRPGPVRQRQQLWAAIARDCAGGTPARALAARQGFVLTHDQARRAGLARAEIRRAVRRGQWSAPRRNALCVLPPAAGDGRQLGTSVEIRAAAAALVRPELTVSHESAAAMHGLPLLITPARPRLTTTGNGGGERDILVHSARLPDDDRTLWFGIPITVVARTVIDIARNAGVRAGLVAADAALAEALLTADELGAAVECAVRWPGVRRARRVVELASPLSESPLESLTRLLVVESGLPTPHLQVPVRTARGRYRVDGLWPERGVVFEADGLLKYAAPSDLRAEKLRQEDLERAGYRVVRVTWQDVWTHPSRTVDRIAAALRLGGAPTLGVG